MFVQTTVPNNWSLLRRTGCGGWSTDPATGWGANTAARENRIVTLNPVFSGEDDFGAYVKNTIHNTYLHPARHQYLVLQDSRPHRSLVEASVRILFGVVNDGPGVVWGPDGPHPVGPWGPLVASVTPEIKQAEIGMAVSQLSEGISDERIKENAQRLGRTLIDRSVHTH